MSVIQEAYESVYDFNNIEGNFRKVDTGSIFNQLSFIQEELKETWDAEAVGDSVGILDGACDLFVTVAGLMQKLAHQGYDVSTAIKRVNENNLSKFPLTLEGQWNPEHSAQFNTEYQRFIFKNTDGKIMKPLGFISVDLSDLVPKEYPCLD